MDEGYTGSLIPLEINVGEQVISALRENTQMDWVFTSKEKAMEGVKSGQYYAAIVVPEKFSTQMMSLFSDQIQKPEIIYYSNAKENAIAPKSDRQGCNRDPETGESGIYKDNIRHGNDGVSVGL